MRKSECGLRPVGAIGAYAPEGRRKHRTKGIEGGIRPPASPSCRLYPPGRSPISANLFLSRETVEGSLKKNEHRTSNVQHRMLNGKILRNRLMI